MHVGNDPDWRNNPTCAGAPFMTIENDDSLQSGWIYDPKPREDVWRYGTERPCNLVGQYVTIFADYSSFTTSYEIALCQWGVMGSRTSANSNPEFATTLETS